MFPHLHLSDPRERWLVGLADLGLAVAAPLVRRSARALPAGARPSVLLLRLERVGDLLMTLDAIAAVRAHAPDAAVDLVVGPWNEELARLIPGIDRVETLRASWLARDAPGDRARHVLAQAWRWRARRYDVAINFEGDVRSNILLGLSGAPRRVGFDMAGGGPLLTDRVRFDPAVHVRTNALRLVERAFALDAGSLAGPAPAPRGGGPAGLRPTRHFDRPVAGEGRSRLQIPAEARDRAAALMGARAQNGRRLVALHASGGREIKQWRLDRLAEVATRLWTSHGVQIVLTGAAGDRPMVDAVKAGLARDVPVVDLAGRADLVTLAAILERVDLLVTGDTGPMHLAAALDVPLVAVFGPSDPARWGPCSASARVVREQIPCSPCNRIRRPPARCRGHVPDCLDAVTADAVYDAATALLDRNA